MSRPRASLVIFARAPQLGRVKTRLAREIGDAAALAAYVGLANECWVQARGAQLRLDARLVVAFTPPEGEDAIREWLTEATEYMSQSSGDLGERMLHAVARELDIGADRVVVMGTDCPSLSAGVLGAAFGALDEADVVIGPAMDGGYYLIGMRGAHSALFADVPWSSPDTLATTLDRAREAGLSVRQLGLLRDVDTAADWADYLSVPPRDATGRDTGEKGEQEARVAGGASKGAVSPPASR